MSKRVLIFMAFILTFGIEVMCQRLSTGFILGVNTFQRMELPDDFIFPQNSYFIYYVGNPEKDDQPIYNQWVNGGSLGFNINLDFRRFMLGVEVKGTTTTTKLEALYPTPLGQLFGEDLSIFKVTRNSWSFPVLLSYKLTKKANGPFLLGGVQYEFNYYSENNGLGSSVSDGVNLFTSERELYGILYNEYNYMSWIAGAGYKRNDSYLSFRLVKRSTSDLEFHPLADYLLIETVFSKTLNFQKLRKGHIIYTE